MTAGRPLNPSVSKCLCAAGPRIGEITRIMPDGRLIGRGDPREVRSRVTDSLQGPERSQRGNARRVYPKRSFNLVNELDCTTYI